MRNLFNKKLNDIKIAFQTIQKRQMEYCKGLNRKLHLYEKVAAEFHGLVNMPLDDIFKGVKLMDEEPEVLWKSITDNFGHEFFLPVIDSQYSHLFVNDVSKQEAILNHAVAQTKLNEETLLMEYQKSLKAL
jgi:hypothetical protein